jgi:hypothetical protein
MKMLDRIHKKKICQLRRTIACGSAWAAVAVFVLQPQLLFAEPGTRVGEQPMRVTDVALGDQGLLVGQLVDAQGRQLSGAEIRLNNSVQTWTTSTDATGDFRIEGLAGSTYQAQVAGQRQIVRAWAPGTAPPQATRGLLLVHDDSVILGQHCASPICNRIACAKYPLSNPFILGGIVAAAVAIPVAIHNHDRDDEPATP